MTSKSNIILSSNLLKYNPIDHYKTIETKKPGNKRMAASFKLKSC